MSDGPKLASKPCAASLLQLQGGFGSPFTPSADRAMALPGGSPARVATRSNTETAKDCAVACKVVVLHVRSRLRGTTIFAYASAVTRVASNLYFTVIAPLPTIRCDCALRSFEVAEPFLLLGTENLVDFGLHASVRDDQPCRYTCFCIGQSFDLLLIYVFTADCKQLLSCSSKRRSSG